MRKCKILKIFCVVAMFMAVIMLVPTMAKAEEQREYVGEEGIFYSTEFDIKNYWGEGKAPIIEDCVFGGWYQKVDNTYKALTEEEAAEAETAYAKFVPAYVLSVKAQNEYGTKADTDMTSVRIITSVDSKSYKAIGFEVYLANRIPLYKDDTNAPLETTRVYDGILVNEQPREAEDIFGAASEYVGVWTLTDIIKDNYSKIIYVRPYWITKDGTKVEGLGKYVHIEDDYNNYISVPVNILASGEIAAGAVDMTYTGLKPAKDSEGKILFEAGRVLPEMSFYPDETNTVIKIVGNGATVNGYNSDETIYANIRFVKPSADTSATFDMTLGKFCDWKENFVKDGTVKVWDIAYEVKGTTN